MTYHYGFRTFWWFDAAIIVLSTVMVVFLFPETIWNRYDQAKSHSSGEQKATVEPNGQAHLNTGFPSKEQWYFYRKPDRHALRKVLYDFWITWKLFSFPIVVFSADFCSERHHSCWC